MTDCYGLQTHWWHCRTHSLTRTHLHPFTSRTPNKWTPIFVLAQTVTPFISITIARKNCIFRTPCMTNRGNRKYHNNVRHTGLLNLKKTRSIRCTTETNTCIGSAVVWTRSSSCWSHYQRSQQGEIKEGIGPNELAFLQRTARSEQRPVQHITYH